MISFTGRDLNITISCAPTPHDSWMLYSCWYSIHRHLPDASVTFILHPMDMSLFNWTNRVPLKLIRKPVDATTILVPCETVAVREFQDETLNLLNDVKLGVSGPVVFYQSLTDFYAAKEQKSLPLYADCQDERAANFIGYTKCGLFDLESWKNRKQEAPFSEINDFITPDITLNESNVFSLWREMIISYSHICVY